MTKVLYYTYGNKCCCDDSAPSSTRWNDHKRIYTPGTYMLCYFFNVLLILIPDAPVLCLLEAGMARNARFTCEFSSMYCLYHLSYHRVDQNVDFAGATLIVLAPCIRAAPCMRVSSTTSQTKTAQASVSADVVQQ